MSLTSGSSLGGVNRNHLRIAQHVDASAEQPATGAHYRHSLSCDARCILPIGETAWVGERSGILSVIDARSGKTLRLLSSTHSQVFATAMVSAPTRDEVWVGTQDGRVCVYDISTFSLLIELRCPETQHSGEITSIVVEGSSIFVAATNCLISHWDTHTKTYIRSYKHQAPVMAMAIDKSVLFAGDGSGQIYFWDAHTGQAVSTPQFTSPTRHDEGLSPVRSPLRSPSTSPRRTKSKAAFLSQCASTLVTTPAAMISTAKKAVAVSSMLIERTTGSLWVGRADGGIDILRIHTSQNCAGQLKGTVTTSSGSKVTCLAEVGGKVWAGGLDKHTYVFQAATHILLGRFKSHASFLFGFAKLYTMETARIWSYSNDKKINVYDAEGFFNPVNQRLDSDEAIAAHSANQQLKAQVDLLTKKLAVEMEKVATRDTEIDSLKTENHTQALKITALDHVISEKDGAIHSSVAEKGKLLDEVQKLHGQIKDLSLRVSEAEKAKMELQGDIARVEEAASRSRAEITSSGSRLSSALADVAELKAVKKQLQAQLEAVEKERDDAKQQLRRVKDEGVAEQLEKMQRDKEVELLKNQAAKLESQLAAAKERVGDLEQENRKRDDQIIVMAHDLSHAKEQLKTALQLTEARSREIQQLTNSKNQQNDGTGRIQDDLLLKEHELEGSKKELSTLSQMLNQERSASLQFKAKEAQYNTKIEDLKRQLEQSKNAVKMLEDQYTIFQFVINSRGELVQCIWNLYDKIQHNAKCLKDLDGGLKNIDPTKDKVTLRQEWKTTVLDRSVTAVRSQQLVQEQVNYILSNYLSEFEKMHLGIPVAKFMPDQKRPAILGEELLSRIKETTLTKHYTTPSPSHMTTTQTARMSPMPSAVTSPSFWSKYRKTSGCAGLTTLTDRISPSIHLSASQLMNVSPSKYSMNSNATTPNFGSTPSLTKTTTPQQQNIVCRVAPQQTQPEAVLMSSPSPTHVQSTGRPSRPPPPQQQPPMNEPLAAEFQWHDLPPQIQPLPPL